MQERGYETMETSEDTQKDKYLTFALGNESYGVHISHVIEIIGIQPITEVPELPSYLKGIINLRGKIIPVMDVRLRFKKEPQEYNDRTCIIVIDVSGKLVGLIVDCVADVLAIPGEDVVPPPQLSRDHNQKYINGIGKVGNSVKLLLDCEKLLSEEELEGLESIA
jgi:purine-binding chemotaxis protein CheW